MSTCNLFVISKLVVSHIIEVYQSVIVQYHAIFCQTSLRKYVSKPVPFIKS